MAKSVEIKNFKNPIEESKRKKFLENIEKYTDTDVLEILSKAASKKGANDKVRKFKMFL